MEWGKPLGWIVKYKYALLILLLGLGLMVLPTAQPREQEMAVNVSEPSMQDQLTSILEKIEGAGNVSVLLTQSRGTLTHFQTDVSEDSDGERNSGDARTVIVTDAQRNESGLVRYVDGPVYLGAVVACQGADRPEVRLAIVEAVRCATGLGANQISVVKMK